MARFEVSEGQLHLRLGPGERVAALTGDVSVPVTEVRDVQVVSHAAGHVDGMKVGTGLPGLLLAGRFYDGNTETIAVCHRSRPGVVVRLRGTSPGLLVASVDDPDAVARLLRRAAGIGPA